MNNNQATLEKMERMGMWGMMQRFRACMDGGAKADLTPDELVSMLVEAEWDERQNRRLSRLLKLARFRYRAGLEDIDFGLKRNLSKNLLKGSACIFPVAPSQTARELELTPKEHSAETAPQGRARGCHDNPARIHFRHNNGDLCFPGCAPMGQGQ
jgi:hypothetical protein